MPGYVFIGSEFQDREGRLEGVSLFLLKLFGQLE